MSAEVDALKAKGRQLSKKSAALFAKARAIEEEIAEFEEGEQERAGDILRSYCWAPVETATQGWLAEEALMPTVRVGKTVWVPEWASQVRFHDTYKAGFKSYAKSIGTVEVDVFHEHNVAAAIERFEHTFWGGDKREPNRHQRLAALFLSVLP